MRMLIMAYQASPSQFRWGMSRADVQDLHALLFFKRIACLSGKVSIEEFARNGISGCLTIRDGWWEYQWYSESSRAMSEIWFWQIDEKPIDIEFVRLVCSSLECQGPPANVPLQEWNDEAIREWFTVAE